MIYFDDYNVLSNMFQHQLHTIDPWVIIDANHKIFLNNHSYKELLCNDDAFIEISQNSINKLKLASESGLTVHHIDKIYANDKEFIVWMCIESVVVANVDKLFVIRMQIIEYSQAFKLSENISSECSPKVHLNLDCLDDMEQQIAALLQSGYTQQAISTLLVTSRSSIVRKIHAICKKIGVTKITSTELKLQLTG